jgi:hypothetical protein
MKSQSIVFISVFVLGACASGGGSALYRRDVGNASGRDAMTIIERVAHQYSYRIENVDTLKDIRVETEWLKRRPFEDETSLGIADAESRLLVVARPRGQTVLGTSYSVTLMVENRLLVQGSASWNESLNTPMFKAYADRIAGAMKQWFTNIGTRVY